MTNPRIPGGGAGNPRGGPSCKKAMAVPAAVSQHPNVPDSGGFWVNSALLLRGVRASLTGVWEHRNLSKVCERFYDLSARARHLAQPREQTRFRLRGFLSAAGSVPKTVSLTACFTAQQNFTHNF